MSYPGIELIQFVCDIRGNCSSMSPDVINVFFVHFNLKSDGSYILTLKFNLLAVIQQCNIHSQHASISVSVILSTDI